jgi:hypothetical protein
MVMATGAPAGTTADGSAPAALAQGTAGHHLGEIDTQKYVEMPVTGMGDIKTEAVSSNSTAEGMVAQGRRRGTNHHLNPRCSADGKGETDNWGWGVVTTPTLRIEYHTSTSHRQLGCLLPLQQPCTAVGA